MVCSVVECDAVWWNMVLCGQVKCGVLWCAGCGEVWWNMMLYDEVECCVFLWSVV